VFCFLFVFLILAWEDITGHGRRLFALWSTWNAFGIKHRASSRVLF
jgi:hypothetical protein